MVGFDLIKETEIMRKAYNCPEFEAVTTNYLTVLNEEFGADFDLDHFQFVSAWDHQEYEQSHYLTSLKDQTVSFAKLGTQVEFFRFENIRVFKSAKLNNHMIQKMASSAGLAIHS